MKLHKILTINSTVYPIAYDEIHLSINNPGRATFTIIADEPITGIITLDIGYNNDPLTRFFNGYIETCTKTNTNEFKLFARERSAILKEPLILDLRHCTLKDLTQKMATITGLNFTVPAVAYTQKPIAFFYNTGTGYNAMDSIGQVFGISDYMWQQQGNGDIFVGSWEDSFWSKIAPLEIPIAFFKDYQSNGMASLACIPKLRPGVKLNNGARIQSIIFIDSEMTIKWKK